MRYIVQLIGIWKISMKFQNSKFSNLWVRNLLWNYFEVIVTGYHWWYDNIGSGNGSVPQPMLTHFMSSCAVPMPQWVNSRKPGYFVRRHSSPKMAVMEDISVTNVLVDGIALLVASPSAGQVMTKSSLPQLCHNPVSMVRSEIISMFYKYEISSLRSCYLFKVLREQSFSTFKQHYWLNYLFSRDESVNCIF